MRQTMRRLCGVLLAISFFAYGPAAICAQSWTPEQVTEHIVLLHGGPALPGAPEKVLQKWTSPVRYRVEGDLSPDQVHNFDLIMETVQKITGHDIARATVGSEANAVFIFMKDIEPWLSRPEFVVLFKQSQSPDEFALDMRKEFTNGISAMKRLTDNRTRSFGAFLNIARVPPQYYPPLMHYMVFTALAGGLSNVIQPSVVNVPLGFGPPEFAPIDQAYLAALYSEDFHVGDPLKDVIDRLVARIMYPARRI